MSGTVTFARINHDGTLMHVPSDGSEEALPAEPIAPLMPEQVKVAVPQGPDAQLLSAADAQPMHLTLPHVASLRRALFLTQKEFAAYYHIPLATLRDWEREHSQPDQPMCAYLAVIARHPEIVRRALQRRSRVDRSRAQKPDELHRSPPLRTARRRPSANSSSSPKSRKARYTVISPHIVWPPRIKSRRGGCAVNGRRHGC